MRMRTVAVALALMFVSLVMLPSVAAESSGNLLRNARFQDDWSSLLLETKNHQWIFTTEYQNRRDYNPDVWWSRGSWRWDHADGEPHERQMVLHGPQATVYQRVNMVMVHDERSLSNFPDAGGFPDVAPVRSAEPLKLVRDHVLRLRVRGVDVPEDGATVELGFAPPGGHAVPDPMGAMTTPTYSVKVSLPAGTYNWRWVEVRLSAADWLATAMASADETTQVEGPVLPASTLVRFNYRGDVGEIAIDDVQLTDAATSSPNLLPHGGFEQAEAPGYDPARHVTPGWSHPRPYRYLPPRHYYLFMTWHNNGHDPRGPVSRDNLVVARGSHSLQMIAAAGDEQAVMSDSIVLNQTEPRLIEVRSLVKTDHLNMLQIDAMDEQGRRLDGFNFIHKSPVSIGTSDWYELRQVFRPREPVKSMRVLLVVRGVNGFTLDDTTEIPQANVVGTAWWDDVRVYEPESTEAELRARGVTIPTPVTQVADTTTPVVTDVDLGERMFGKNTMRLTLRNDSDHVVNLETLRLKVDHAEGMDDADLEGLNVAVALEALQPGERRRVELPYRMTATRHAAYTEYRGRIEVTGATDAALWTRATDFWFTTWTTPLDIELGQLYLQPDRDSQLVRVNLGVSASTMQVVDMLRLELIRRDTGDVLETVDLPASPSVIASIRDRLPMGLRDDLRNLLLADVSVARLPLQAFDDPQRHWVIRATVLDVDGQAMLSNVSQPFCRLAHEPPQPGVETVRIDARGDLYVNDQPYMPWGAVYGHFPVYDGPASPHDETYRDLRNLTGWGYYDGYTSATYNRHTNDMNTIRYFPGWGGVRVMKYFEDLQELWEKDNIYSATTWITTYPPPWSVEELVQRTGGPEAHAAIIEHLRSAPYAPTIGPGVEETFAVFHEATAEQLAGLEEVVSYLRETIGKPVMVGHGGSPIRAEFDKVPFFDVFDPETEPIHPAPVHVELAPVLGGQAKTMWLRPQMYESVPYERWRYHTYVELIRGVRGWQMAHGPGDQSLFRGLHGELKHLSPIVHSHEPTPEVRIEPATEHMARRHDGKLYVIAATTHPNPFGRLVYDDTLTPPAGRARVTGFDVPDDQVADSYGYFNRGGRPPEQLHAHGLHWLPLPERYEDAAYLTQWVRVDPDDPTAGVTVLVRGDGNFAHAAHWGEPIRWAMLREDMLAVHWYMRAFYRHAPGIISWGTDRAHLGLPYMPEQSHSVDHLPEAGQWVQLRVSVEDLKLLAPATDDASTDAPRVKLIDGVGFLHDGGRVAFGATELVMRDGRREVLWGQVPGGITAEQRRSTRFHIPGLKAGATIRRLFDHQTLAADRDGSFVDDLGGEDLYQRYGSSFHHGYGYLPVAFRLYEIESPAE